MPRGRRPSIAKADKEPVKASPIPRKSISSNKRRRASDEDADFEPGGEADQDEGSGGGPRRRYNAQQLAALEGLFQLNDHADSRCRDKIAKLCDDYGFEPDRVRYWFQNRRTKRKQQGDRAESIVLNNEKMLLEKKMDEIIAENDELLAENAKIRAENDGLLAENAKLRAENDQLRALVDRQSAQAAAPVYVAQQPAAQPMAPVFAGSPVFVGQAPAQAARSPQAMTAASSLLPLLTPNVDFNASLEDFQDMLDDELQVEQDPVAADALQDFQGLVQVDMAEMAAAQGGLNASLEDFSQRMHTSLFEGANAGWSGTTKSNGISVASYERGNQRILCACYNHQVPVSPSRLFDLVAVDGLGIKSEITRILASNGNTIAIYECADPDGELFVVQTIQTIAGQDGSMVICNAPLRQLPGYEEFHTVDALPSGCIISKAQDEVASVLTMVEQVEKMPDIDEATYMAALETKIVNNMNRILNNLS